MANDPYRYFRIEARELLDQLARAALDLDRGDAASVAQMLRAAHTLKGAARVVTQAEVADLAHQLEDQLVPHRDGGPAPGLAGRVLPLTDRIAERLRALDGEPPRAPEGAPAAAVDAPETVRIELREMDALSHGVTEASSILQSLRREAAAIDELRRTALAVADGLAARELSPAGLSRLRGGAEDLAGRLARLDRAVDGALEQVAAELHQVHDTADRLRLSPVDAVFSSLARGARDAADALGKQVVFAGHGDAVRLDAHVLDALRGALLQAVRNAVAHGIERPAARAAAGKPPAGRVSLHIERRADTITFAVSDDGAGVDLDAVRAAAARRGLSGAAALDDAAAIDLLLRGGLSTRAGVDELAGRGVGLDVVRAVAAQLHGRVALRSERGRGATLEIVLPTSLVATRALSVEADGVAVALPLEAVRRVVRIDAAALARTPERESLLYDGEAIPFVPLAAILGRGGPPRPSPTALLVRAGGRDAAVGVDRLLGVAELVARPLPVLVHADRVVAGAALDAEGTPRLLLDPIALVARAAAARPPAAVASRAKPPILVVDDSLTTRMLEKAILESAGYEVDLATSGDEGLEKVRRRIYGLLLVDVEMPGMDGYSFVARLRADPGTRGIPVIMVTSRGSDDDRRRSTEAGAQGHVLKGEFDQATLLAAIARWTA